MWFNTTPRKVGIEVTLNHQGNILLTDKHGYLLNLGDWTPDVAEQIANTENICLSEAHWDVISVLRQFYQEYEVSPAMRILVKQVGIALGSDKGKSIYLMQLFPPSPAKIASKIAGLPRPDNCL